MQDTGWDHALKVTGDGEGLVGHAGAVLLRKLADQAGLTTALGSGAGTGREVPAGRPGDRAGVRGGGDRARATSMSDITLLAQHAPVLGAEPSDTTVRRTLELAGPRTLDKIAGPGPRPGRTSGR